MIPQEKWFYHTKSRKFYDAIAIECEIIKMLRTTEDGTDVFEFELVITTHKSSRRVKQFPIPLRGKTLVSPSYKDESDARKRANDINQLLA